MSHLSKQIINNCISSLSKSTDAGFHSGDVEDFSDWAIRMRNTINNVVPQLQSISNSIQVERTPSLHPSDKEVETWFADNIADGCSASSAIFKFRLWLKDREISNMEKVFK